MKEGDRHTKKRETRKKQMKQWGGQKIIQQFKGKQREHQQSFYLLHLYVNTLFNMKHNVSIILFSTSLCQYTIQHEKYNFEYEHCSRFRCFLEKILICLFVCFKETFLNFSVPVGYISYQCTNWH